MYISYRDDEIHRHLWESRIKWSNIKYDQSLAFLYIILESIERELQSFDHCHRHHHYHQGSIMIE